MPGLFWIGLLGRSVQLQLNFLSKQAPEHNCPCIHAPHTGTAKGCWKTDGGRLRWAEVYKESQVPIHSLW